MMRTSMITTSIWGAVILRVAWFKGGVIQWLYEFACLNYNRPLQPNLPVQTRLWFDLWMLKRKCDL